MLAVIDRHTASHLAPAEQLSGTPDGAVRVSVFKRRKRIVGGSDGGEVCIVGRHEVMSPGTVPVAESALSIAYRVAYAATMSPLFEELANSRTYCSSSRASVAEPDLPKGANLT